MLDAIIWGGLAIVTAAMGYLWVRVSLPPAVLQKRRIFYVYTFLVLGCIAIVLTGRYSNILFREAITAKLVGVGKAVDFINREVETPVPGSFDPTQEPLQSRPSVQARMQVFDFEILPIVSGKPASMKFYVQNNGNADGDIQVFSVAALYKYTDDESEQMKNESGLFNVLIGTAKKASQFYDKVPPGSGKWFTNTGPILSKEQLQELRDGKSILYFLGDIKYKDAAGTRHTTYCRYSGEDPSEIFPCHQYSEENIAQLEK